MSHQTLEQLVEALSALSVLDMSKLKSALEEKWGVKAAAAAAPVVVAAAAPVAAAAESTEFKVSLEAAPADKKIGIIKVIREITGLGLKEAKDLVEGAPKVIKESTTKADAEDIQKKLDAAGGKVTIVGL
ncbi:MAG: 50S ribosomal protein L7/L12 [Rhabdochlamydiaceae bacterium]